MRWRQYEHVFFDCDSTLTSVEGIDILADTAGKRWRVEVLTQAAMEGELDLEEIYDKRLRDFKPTHQQIRDIRRAYKQHVAENARETISALQELWHKVYIISGGLLEPVREFGIFLGVPKDHIRAVGVTYNELSGKWWISSDEQYMTFNDGALTVSDGKADIIKEFLAGQRGRSLLVGDGYSDLIAGNSVDLFVGFGGFEERSRVREQAPVYVKSASLAPILTLAAGPAALITLRKSEYQTLREKTLALLEEGVISFTDKQLQARFERAVTAAQQSVESGVHQSSPADPEQPDALDDWSSTAPGTMNDL